MEKSYFKRVWQNAVQNTWPSWRVRVIVLSGFGLIAGAFATYWFGGAAFAAGQLKGWLLGPFVGAGTTNLLHFVLNLLLAPRRIDTEALVKIDTLNHQVAILENPTFKIRSEYMAKQKLEISTLIASLTSAALDYGHANLSLQNLAKIQEDIDCVKAKIEIFANSENLWSVCNDAVHWANIVIGDRQKNQVDQNDRKKVFELSKEAMRLLQNN